MNYHRSHNPKLYDLFASVFWRYPKQYTVGLVVYNDGHQVLTKDSVTVWGISLDFQVRKIPALLRSGKVDIVVTISPDGDLWSIYYFAGTGKLRLKDHRTNLTNTLDNAALWV